MEVTEQSVAQLNNDEARKRYRKLHVNRHDLATIHTKRLKESAATLFPTLLIQQPNNTPTSNHTLPVHPRAIANNW